ncbi:ABC transporter permease [Staphylothermus hellenicus]|uniref:ABC-2 type transporter n=1 Tax=Staphylothermus hellenicus (strain DSM 12710 / JCM 10830 / BK20S6-10-b1 / P8) TaxID=591019 RepID=D7D8S0_STAHD|nr:ABC transporter permease [Staphylothermus hellenicus]ADI32166.1 ABC-2 type transporter [Staphylothermus hellenicus DSM 12710]
MRTTYFIRVLMWKELTDLIRDKKTLFTSILLPLIMLPLIGLLGVALVTQQPVLIAIIDLDNTSYHNDYLNITYNSSWVVHNLTHVLSRYGYNYTISSNESIVKNPKIDLAVVIPKGFAKNSTLLNTTARVIIYRKAGVQAAERAEATVNSVLYYLSMKLSDEKINSLSKILNITIIPQALRKPIQSRTEVVTITGVPAQPGFELKAAFARILVLALSFVVTPAASYVIDGIVGERERKTMELLISSPASLNSIIYSKMIAATILGLITAVADALGLVAYMFLLSIASGIGLGVIVDPMLLLIHSITAFFTILATITIALPFITRTKGIRSASNIAGIVTTIGIVFFFTGFLVDYIRLPPEILYPLYIVPYVHSILVIQSYMLGYVLRSILHISVLAIVSIGLLVLATKTINTEKLLIAQS